MRKAIKYNIVILGLLLALAAPAAGENVRTGTLEFQNVEPVWDDQGADFELYGDTVSLTAKQIFVPDAISDKATVSGFEYQNGSSAERVQFTGITFDQYADFGDEGVNDLLGRGGPDASSSEYPVTYFSKGAFTSDLLTNGSRGDVFDYNYRLNEPGYSVEMRTNFSSEYDALVVDYELVYISDGQTETVKEWTDTYNGARPDVVKLDAETSSHGLDQYLNFTIDNSFRDSKEYTVVLGARKNNNFFRGIESGFQMEKLDSPKSWYQKAESELSDKDFKTFLEVESSDYKFQAYNITVGEDSKAELKAKWQTGFNEIRPGLNAWVIGSIGGTTTTTTQSGGSEIYTPHVNFDFDSSEPCPPNNLGQASLSGATCYGSPTKNNNNWFFDGNDDGLQYDQGLIGSNGQDKAWAFEFKTPSQHPSSNAPIVRYENIDSFTQYPSSNDGIYAHAWDGNNPNTIYSGTLQTDTLYRVVLWLDDSDGTYGTLKMYVNGSLKDSNAIGSLGVQNKGSGNGNVEGIGTYVGNNFLNGYLKQIKTYENGLSSSQINNLNDCFYSGGCNDAPVIDSLDTTEENWTVGTSQDLTVDFSDPDASDSDLQGYYRVRKENSTGVYTVESYTSINLDSNGFGTKTDAFTVDSGGYWILDVRAVDNDGGEIVRTFNQSIEEQSGPSIVSTDRYPQNPLYNDTVTYEINSTAGTATISETCLEVNLSGSTIYSQCNNGGGAMNFTDAYKAQTVNTNYVGKYTVTDSDGATASAFENHTVSDTAPGFAFTQPDLGGSPYNASNVTVEYDVQTDNDDVPGEKYHFTLEANGTQVYSKVNDEPSGTFGYNVVDYFDHNPGYYDAELSLKETDDGSAQLTNGPSSLDYRAFEDFPEITIHKPTSNQVFEKANVPLEVTATADGSIESYEYNIGNGYQTFTPNITIEGLADGDYTLDVRVNDSFGLSSTKSVDFTVDFVKLEMFEPENNSEILDGNPVNYKARVTAPNGTVQIVENGTSLATYSHVNGTTNYTLTNSQKQLGTYDVYVQWVNETSTTTTSTTYNENFVDVDNDFESGSFTCENDGRGFYNVVEGGCDNLTVVSDSRVIEGDYSGEIKQDITYYTGNESYGDTNIKFKHPNADEGTFYIDFDTLGGAEDVGSLRLDAFSQTLEWHPDGDITTESDAVDVTQVSDNEVIDLTFDWDYTDSRVFIENASSDSIDDNFATADLASSSVDHTGRYFISGENAVIDDFRVEDINDSYVVENTNTISSGDNSTDKSKNVTYTRLRNEKAVNLSILNPPLKTEFGVASKTRKDSDLFNFTTDRYQLLEYFYGDVETSIDGTMAFEYREVTGDAPFNQPWTQFTDLEASDTIDVNAQGDTIARTRYNSTTIPNGSSQTLSVGGEEVTFEVRDTYVDSGGLRVADIAVNGAESTYLPTETIQINNEVIRVDNINLEADDVTLGFYPEHDVAESVYQYRLNYTTDSGAEYSIDAFADYEGFNFVRNDWIEVSADSVLVANSSDAVEYDALRGDIIVPQRGEHSLFFQFDQYWPAGVGRTVTNDDLNATLEAPDGSRQYQTPFVFSEGFGTPWKVNQLGTYKHWVDLEFNGTTFRNSFFELTIEERSLENESYVEDLKEQGFEEPESGTATNSTGGKVKYWFSKKSPTGTVELPNVGTDANIVLEGPVNFEYIISYNGTQSFEEYLWVTLPNGTVEKFDLGNANAGNADVLLTTQSGTHQYKYSLKVDGKLYNSSTENFEVLNADRIKLSDFGDFPDAGIFQQIDYLSDVAIAAFAQFSGNSQYLVGTVLSLLFIGVPYIFFAVYTEQVVAQVAAVISFLFTVLVGLMPEFNTIGLFLLGALYSGGKLVGWINGD